MSSRAEAPVEYPELPRVLRVVYGTCTTSRSAGPQWHSVSALLPRSWLQPDSEEPVEVSVQGPRGEWVEVSAQHLPTWVHDSLHSVLSWARGGAQILLQQWANVKIKEGEESKAVPGEWVVMAVEEAAKGYSREQLGQYEYLAKEHLEAVRQGERDDQRMRRFTGR